MINRTIYCAITKKSATTSFVVQQQLLIRATASSPWSPRIGRWRSTSARRRACLPTSWNKSTKHCTMWSTVASLRQLVSCLSPTSRFQLSLPPQCGQQLLLPGVLNSPRPNNRQLLLPFSLVFSSHPYDNSIIWCQCNPCPEGTQVHPCIAAIMTMETLATVLEAGACRRQQNVRFLLDLWWRLSRFGWELQRKKKKKKKTTPRTMKKRFIPGGVRRGGGRRQQECRPVLQLQLLEPKP